MTLCVIDGGHCVCQPDEGMPCVPAINMKAELTAAKTQIEDLQLRVRELEDVKADNFRMDATITRLVYQLKAEREVLLTEQALSDKLEKALKLAVKQNNLDMLLTGDELRECSAALAEVAHIRSQEVAAT